MAMADQETMRRLAAIRRLARQMPLENANERLGKIAEVAAGTGDVEGVFKSGVQDNLSERLIAGAASRSPMVGDKPQAQPKKKDDEDEAAKKRKLTGGRDRKERSGIMRNPDTGAQGDR